MSGLPETWPFLLIGGDDGAFVQRQTGELPCVYGQCLCGVRTVQMKVLLFSVCSQLCPFSHHRSDSS